MVEKKIKMVKQNKKNCRHFEAFFVASLHDKDAHIGFIYMSAPNYEVYTLRVCNEELCMELCRNLI